MSPTRVLLAFMVILAAIFVAPTAQANNQFCHTESTVKVSGLINVADVVICTSHQDEYGEVGDVIAMNLRVSLPNAAFTPTITLTASTPIGCTAGTPVTRTISGVTGAATSYFNTFTTTDTTCTLSLHILIQAVATTVFTSDESFGAFCQCEKNAAPGESVYTVAGWTLTGPPSLVSITVPDTVTIPIVFNGVYGGPIGAIGLGWDSTSPVVTSDGTCTFSEGLTNSWDNQGGEVIVSQASSLTMQADATWCSLTVLGGPFFGTYLASAIFNVMIQRDLTSGQLTVDIADDSTDDGQLTIPVGEFIVGNQTVTFPDEFTANVAFPGDASDPSVDFWLHAVFWIILLAFFLYQAWWFAAAFAIPGLLDALFPTQIPDDLSLYLVLCLLGVVLEVAAHKFSFAHWRTRNTRA